MDDETKKRLEDLYESERELNARIAQQNEQARYGQSEEEKREQLQTSVERDRVRLDIGEIELADILRRFQANATGLNQEAKLESEKTGNYPRSARCHVVDRKNGNVLIPWREVFVADLTPEDDNRLQKLLKDWSGGKL